LPVTLLQGGIAMALPDRLLAKAIEAPRAVTFLPKDWL
jgi:hypothetical protein